MHLGIGHDNNDNYPHNVKINFVYCGHYEEHEFCLTMYGLLIFFTNIIKKLVVQLRFVQHASQILQFSGSQYATLKVRVHMWIYRVFLQPVPPEG